MTPDHTFTIDQFKAALEYIAAYNNTPSTTFTASQVFTAMCIWEEMCAPASTDATTPWQETREQVGANELRERVLMLVGPCDAAWERAQELFDIEVQKHQKARSEYQQSIGGHRDLLALMNTWDTKHPWPDDPGAFDWEFVPFWLRAAVDWSDVHGGPRVLGARKPENQL